MMMGVGLLFMLLIGLVVIGVPLLLVAIATGWLSGWLKSPSQPVDRQPPLVSQAPASARNCPACGRSVKADWNVCPSCGAALA